MIDRRARLHRALDRALDRRRAHDADPNAESGEPVTGFETAQGLGPFECANCTHVDNGLCHHPVMMENSRQPRDENGYVHVGPHDCCTFVRRK